MDESFSCSISLSIFVIVSFIFSDRFIVVSTFIYLINDEHLSMYLSSAIFFDEVRVTLTFEECFPIDFSSVWI
jgi:hypothetical protein